MGMMGCCLCLEVPCRKHACSAKEMPLQAAGLGGWYNESNVGISGIHTHSGPGGYLQYVLYDITSLGFVEQSWEAVVDGIATVSAAHLPKVHEAGQCEHCCDAVMCSSPAGDDPLRWGWWQKQAQDCSQLHS